MALTLSDALGNKKRFVQDVYVNFLRVSNASKERDQTASTSLAITSASGGSLCPGKVVSISSQGNVSLMFDDGMVLEGIEQTQFDS